MSLWLVVRPEAEAEFLEAQVWYESRREGLGARFAVAVDASVAKVLAAPLAFPRVRGDIRRSLIMTFPYAMYYQIVANEVVILAIMHGRRHPRLWRSRR